MSRNGNDVTYLIQRLERFEDRWGFTLERLSGWLQDHFNTVEVSGELRLTTGLELPQRTFLILACYDENNRVINIQKDAHSPESFYGFSVFSVSLQTFGYQIKKILIYPTPF